PRRQQHAATQPPNPGPDVLTHQYGQVSDTKSAIAEKAGPLNQSIKSGSKAARSKQAASPRVYYLFHSYLTALTGPNLVAASAWNPKSRSSETTTASS
ncbi:MAG: hypothetical protein Q9185_006753, partial [Variospora sp. 1 TL-2023]